LRSRPPLEAQDAAVHHIRGVDSVVGAYVRDVVEGVDALVLGLREERGGGDRPWLGPKTGARGMIAVKQRWWWFGRLLPDNGRVEELDRMAEDDGGRP
jgi:hypothetical protein